MGRVSCCVLLSGLAAGVAMLAAPGPVRAQTAAVERTPDGGARVVVRATSGADLFSLTALAPAPLFSWRAGLRYRQALPEQAGEGCSVVMIEFVCVLPHGAAARPPDLYGERGHDYVYLHEAGGPVRLHGGPGNDTVSLFERGAQDGARPLANTPLDALRSEVYVGAGDDSVGQAGRDQLQLYGPLPGSCRSGPLAPLGAVVYGGPGSDRVCDTLGDDRLVVRDGEIDAAGCTDGRDVVVADRADAVLGDCEQVERAGRPGRQGAAAFETIVDENEGLDRVSLAVAVACQADGPRFCPVRLRLSWPGSGKQLGKQLQFGVARGFVARPLFLLHEYTLERLARTGVRATTFTELRSGRLVRTSRLLRVALPPESGS
jgi:hypothetical protein